MSNFWKLDWLFSHSTALSCHHSFHWTFIYIHISQNPLYPDVPKVRSTVNEAQELTIHCCCCPFFCYITHHRHTHLNKRGRTAFSSVWCSAFIDSRACSAAAVCSLFLRMHLLSISPFVCLRKLFFEHPSILRWILIKLKNFPTHKPLEGMTRPIVYCD
jgi:hypothetical protein